MLTVDYAKLGVRPGDRLLDLGCGFGRHAFEAARRGARVVACDMSDAELKEVRATFGAMAEAGQVAEEGCTGAVNGDAVHLPFADASFDRVIASEVMEHIPNDAGAMAELTRVLRPGGTIAVTVPAWLPEKVCWWLSDEYHAPYVEGGHVAHLHRGPAPRSHARRRSRARCVTPRPLSAQPVLVAALRGGPDERRQPSRRRVPPLPGMGHHQGADLDTRGRSVPQPRARQEPRGLRPETDDTEAGHTMTRLPEVEGVLNAAQLSQTVDALAADQLPNGLILWHPGGHSDPWNHVEAAMALAVGGRNPEAERAYDWLVAHQLPNGAWHNYYVANGIEDLKLDTNVCAYVATGVWHHYLLTRDRGFIDAMWSVVERAIDFVLSMQTARGEIIWARHTDGTPWSYALLTGSSSICHSLRCAVAIAETVGEERPDWELAAANLAHVVAHVLDAFEPKDRWAMDWYYPVLGGIVTGSLRSGSARGAPQHVRDGRARSPLRRRPPVGDRRGDLRSGDGLSGRSVTRRRHSTSSLGPRPIGSTTAAI